MATVRFLDRQLLSTAHRARALMPQRHHILIACFPKTGSTWLRTILTGLPGFRSCWVSDSTGRGEQELSAHRLARASFTSFVAQHHVRHHDQTRRLAEAYQLKPVVLVRDVFDSVVSLRDHVRQRWSQIPQALVSPEVLGLGDDDLADFLIDMAIPWYIDFYVSWTASPAATMVRYEELRRDPAATVDFILRRLSVPASRDDIAAAIDAARDKDVLLNQGIVGRGATLSEAQRGRIARLASYYPTVDFAPIGLATGRR